MQVASKNVPSDQIKVTPRVYIRKDWQSKGFYLNFRHAGISYLVPHDEVVAIANEITPWLTTYSWNDLGWYSTRSPSKRMLEKLSQYAIST